MMIKILDNCRILPTYIQIVQTFSFVVIVDVKFLGECGNQCLQKHICGMKC